MATKHDQVRVAILGSRGIPAEFGGFETFAEELAVRLVKKGYAVTVFCEDSQVYQEPTYRGVTLRYVRTPRIVGLRSIWGDIAGITRAIGQHDILYMLGYPAAFAYFLPRLFNRTLWTNMDGLDWKRSKWSRFPRLYLRVMEFLAVKLSSVVIADAEAMRHYLVEKYSVDYKTVTIPYGANIVTKAADPALVQKNGLLPDEYYLVVCRLEPENHVLEIVSGFIRSNSQKILAIVGDHTASTAYVKRLKSLSDGRIVFLGGIYDKKVLEAIRFHCFAYFHGHSVGGTNPSLLEAMACGNVVIAHDNVFNREVTDGSALFFEGENDITRLIEKIENEGSRDGFSEKLKTRLSDHYNWDRVSDMYADLIERRSGSHLGPQSR